MVNLYSMIAEYDGSFVKSKNSIGDSYKIFSMVLFLLMHLTVLLISELCAVAAKKNP